jgi:hypothetical protein
MGYELALRFSGHDTREELVEGLLAIVKQNNLYARIAHDVVSSDGWVHDVAIDVFHKATNDPKIWPLFQITFGSRSPDGNAKQSDVLEECFKRLNNLETESHNTNIEYVYFLDNDTGSLSESEDDLVQIKKYFTNTGIDFDYAEL